MICEVDFKGYIMEFSEVSGPRWTLRSSRVSRSDRNNPEESQSLLETGTKSKPWKAKREDYDEDIPLERPKNRVPDNCVEAEVQPGDTLQSMSLKYNVPLAELKRVNNLLSEAEFYALKRLKIPVKTASLLTEMLPSALDKPNENGWYVQSAASSSTVQSSTPVSEADNGSQMDPLDIPTTHQLVDLGPDSPPVSKQTKKANKFLRNVDKDLARIKEKTERMSITPERDDELTLSTLTSSGDFTTTKLVMPTTQREPGWCSKSGLCCLVMIVICVSAILAFAYLGYHSQLFVSHSEKNIHHADHS